MRSDQRKVLRLTGLFGLCGFSKLADFQQAHRQWVEIALRDELSVRDARWSEAVAVGSLAFVEKVKERTRIQSGASRSDFLDLSGDSVGIQNRNLSSNAKGRKSKIDWVKLTGDNLTAKMRL